MLSNYKIWCLQNAINETNLIIDDFNRFLVAQYRRRLFWEGNVSVTVAPHLKKNLQNSPKKLQKSEAEIKLPKLGYLHRRRDGQPGAQWFIDEEKKNQTPNPEKVGIQKCILKAYKDEASVQREGIRFAPGVIANKINHRVLNYDQIQDKITAMINNGDLDCCDALNIRIALQDKKFTMGRAVIEMLDFPLRLHDGKTLSHSEVYSTYERFYRRDIDKLLGERRQENCGDCGGERSSVRNSQNPRR